jgi:hypothetical protein
MTDKATQPAPELVPIPSTVELMEEVAREASRSMLDFFRSGIDDAQGIAKARVAASAVASFSRMKQAESAHQAMLVSLSRDLAKDKDELQAYIRATMPNSPLVKALPVPQPQQTAPSAANGKK